MRDRLIWLIKNAEKAFPKDKPVLDIEEFTADFLLANGVIVPPCKVGDKLYIVAGVSGKIVECTIIGVWIFGQSCAVITDFGTIHNNSLGKSVFLTREEAEAKLKGGASDGKLYGVYTF